MEHLLRLLQFDYVLSYFSDFRFTKFDLLISAVNRGLPVTRTICRMELQDILVDAVGFEILSNRSKLWTSYKPLRR